MTMRMLRTTTALAMTTAMHTAPVTTITTIIATRALAG